MPSTAEHGLAYHYTDLLLANLAGWASLLAVAILMGILAGRSAFATGPLRAGALPAIPPWLAALALVLIGAWAGASTTRWLTAQRLLGAESGGQPVAFMAAWRSDPAYLQYVSC